jgi:hypothetical protein
MIDNLWKFKTMVKSDISYRFQESSVLLGEMLSLSFLDTTNLSQEQTKVNFKKKNL